MNTVVARVLRVLSGHSTAAMVHAVDEHGHEHKLEVPSSQAADLAPGAVLVLQWSVHRLPDTLAQSPANETTPRPESSARATTPPTAALGSTERSAADAGEPRTSTPSLDLPEPLASLLGLRSGRNGRT